MKDFLPPACFVLSLLLLISGFAVMVRERPQPSVELHRARVEDDEPSRVRLEQQLERRRLERTFLVVSLLGMAVILAAAGFVTMRPAGSR